MARGALALSLICNGAAVVTLTAMDKVYYVDERQIDDILKRYAGPSGFHWVEGLCSNGSEAVLQVTEADLVRSIIGKPWRKTIYICRKN
jgi:hypothetical protein